MTFIEALAEYHKGKAIRRKTWRQNISLSHLNFWAPYDNTTEKMISVSYWIDLLADDWIVVEEEK